MLLKEVETGYTKITEREYTPTKEELFWYYSGTHGGLNPDNPYALRCSSVKSIKYVKRPTTTEKKEVK